MKIILSLLDSWDVESLKLGISLFGGTFYELNMSLQDNGRDYRMYLRDWDKDYVSSPTKGLMDRGRSQLNLGLYYIPTGNRPKELQF